MKSLLIDDVRDIDADVVARTFEAGIEALKAHKFDVLYLDHDLGDEDPRKTGYDILNFLENNPQFLPSQKIILVTSNPVGRIKMQALIKKLYETKKD